MSRPLDLSGLTLALLRRLLYLWVRPAVLPENPAELGLDPARPVCYVLDERYLSNLLVLIAETRRAGLPRPRGPLALGALKAKRSFFFLERARRLVATAKERHGHSPLLVDMLRAALADPACDVQIVPVTLLWGRAPDKQDTILKALFAETWRAPGRLRQFFAVLLHGRQALLRFGAPLSLRQLLADEPEEARALRKLARLLRVHFRRQREIAIGPDLSHRNTQVDALLETPALRAAIAAEAAAKNVTADEAERRARGFALEIASDYTYGVVRAFVLFLTWLWTRLYAGVEVRNVEAVTRIAPGQGIVYLPCHRSHIDYLLLSYVVYQRGLTPPHIAAGANLNIPVVGPLLRRGGAFFLRRSFKGEPLYAAVFHEYLHMMLARGFPIEYFIEGGRSRSGRMLSPKAGILGMTIRSFLRGQTRPLVFVPVYLGYEKLLEGQAFLDELQGKPKQGESLWGLLGAWRLLAPQVRQGARELRRAAGARRVPRCTAPGLEGRGEGNDPRAEWLRPVIRDAAEELARRINAAAVVTPVNLVALALLATPKHTADAQALRARSSTIGPCCARRLAPPASPAARCRPPRRSPTPRASASSSACPTRSANCCGCAPTRRRCSPTSATTCCTSSPCRRSSPACSAATGGSTPAAWRRRWPASMPLLRAELFLHGSAETLPGAMAAAVDVMSRRGLMRRNPETGRYAAPEPTSQAFAELRLLGETIRPTLERHFLTLALLQRQGSGRIDAPRAGGFEPPARPAPGLALRVQCDGVLGEVALRRGRRPAARLGHPAGGRGRPAAFRRAHHRARRAGRAGALGGSAPDHPAHGRRARRCRLVAVSGRPTFPSALERRPARR
jgi:glycerol-3-phosphate O-acyltransferase